jgi:energy-coupling factor transport system ATP-binding protein
MDKIAVEFKNYAFRYHNTEDWVLKDINFRLHYGELIVLSGLSGEGKSTLLYSINRIIPNIIQGECKGEFLLNGENALDKMPSEVSRLVGSVLQNADSQIINHVVEDEIAFGCENMNMDSDKIDEAINRSCQLMSLQPEWFTRTLSGGQKQRLITASILAMQQKILVFDEPLANLDLEGAHNLLLLLKELSKNGYAILIIEHRLDVVLPYADSVAWLSEGHLSVSKSEERIEKYTGSIRLEHRNLAKKEKAPCFHLNNIEYTAGNRTILRDLSFTLYKGERVVILGENGCGKTTLLRLLSRLIKPTAGTYEQFMEPDHRKKPSKTWFKKLGFVYQNPNYQLFMPNVKQEVGYQSKEEQNTEDMIHRFRLDELMNRHPQSLSEGQKRRLTIACVMAMEPETLLLDEPTVGQDFEGLKNILEQLYDIHEKTNNTMITITHDFRCAKAFADRILWMKEGRIYKDGGSELADEYFEEILSSYQEI